MCTNLSVLAADLAEPERLVVAVDGVDAALGAHRLQAVSHRRAWHCMQLGSTSHATTTERLPTAAATDLLAVVAVCGRGTQQTELVAAQHALRRAVPSPRTLPPPPLTFL